VGLTVLLLVVDKLTHLFASLININKSTEINRTNTVDSRNDTHNWLLYQCCHLLCMSNFCFDIQISKVLWRPHRRGTTSYCLFIELASRFINKELLVKWLIHFAETVKPIDSRNILRLFWWSFRSHQKHRSSVVSYRLWRRSSFLPGHTSQRFQSLDLAICISRWATVTQKKLRC